MLFDDLILVYICFYYIIHKKIATTEATRLIKISNIMNYLIELQHIHFLNFFLNVILSALSMPSLGHNDKFS